MAAINVPASLTPLGQNSVTFTALTASTNYTLSVTWPSGRGQTIPFTTDGSGAATVKVTPMFDDRGVPKFEVRPTTELSGGTTPVLTSTAGKV